MLITIIVGVVFGLTAIDVLLGRDIAVVLFTALDYTLIALGFWLAIKALLGKVTRDAL